MSKFVGSIVKVIAIVIITVVLCWILLPYIVYNDFFIRDIGSDFLYLTLPSLFSFSIILITYLLKIEEFFLLAVFWNIAIVFMGTTVLSSWSQHCDLGKDLLWGHQLFNYLLVLCAFYFLVKRFWKIGRLNQVIFVISCFLILIDLNYLFFSLHLVGPLLY